MTPDQIRELPEKLRKMAGESLSHQPHTLVNQAANALEQLLAENERLKERGDIGWGKAHDMEGYVQELEARIEKLEALYTVAKHQYGRISPEFDEAVAALEGKE